MDADREARTERKRRLLRELAELQVAEMGHFDEAAHFGIIERAASELGKELSREAQERAAREIATTGETQAACPVCGELCDLKTKRRSSTSFTPFIVSSMRPWHWRTRKRKAGNTMHAISASVGKDASTA